MSTRHAPVRADAGTTGKSTRPKGAARGGRRRQRRSNTAETPPAGSTPEGAEPRANVEHRAADVGDENVGKQPPTDAGDGQRDGEAIEERIGDPGPGEKAVDKANESVSEEMAAVGPGAERGGDAADAVDGPDAAVVVTDAGEVEEDIVGDAVDGGPDAAVVVTGAGEVEEDVVGDAVVGDGPDRPEEAPARVGQQRQELPAPAGASGSAGYEDDLFESMGDDSDLDDSTRVAMGRAQSAATVLMHSSPPRISVDEHSAEEVEQEQHAPASQKQRRKKTAPQRQPLSLPEAWETVKHLPPAYRRIEMDRLRRAGMIMSPDAHLPPSYVDNSAPEFMRGTRSALGKLQHSPSKELRRKPSKKHVERIRQERQRAKTTNNAGRRGRPRPRGDPHVRSSPILPMQASRAGDEDAALSPKKPTRRLPSWQRPTLAQVARMHQLGRELANTRPSADWIARERQWRESRVKAAEMERQRRIEMHEAYEMARAERRVDEAEHLRLRIEEMKREQATKERAWKLARRKSRELHKIRAEKEHELQEELRRERREQERRYGIVTKHEREKKRREDAAHRARLKMLEHHQVKRDHEDQLEQLRKLREDWLNGEEDLHVTIELRKLKLRKIRATEVLQGAKDKSHRRSQSQADRARLRDNIMRSVHAEESADQVRHLESAMEAKRSRRRSGKAGRRTDEAEAMTLLEDDPAAHSNAQFTRSLRRATHMNTRPIHTRDSLSKAPWAFRKSEYEIARHAELVKRVDAERPVMEGRHAKALLPAVLGAEEAKKHARGGTGTATGTGTCTRTANLGNFAKPTVAEAMRLGLFDNRSARNLQDLIEREAQETETAEAARRDADSQKLKTTSMSNAQKTKTKAKTKTKKKKNKSKQTKAAGSASKRHSAGKGAITEAGQVGAEVEAQDDVVVVHETLRVSSVVPDDVSHAPAGPTVTEITNV